MDERKEMIDLEESDEIGDIQPELFGAFGRSKSDDAFLGNLVQNPMQSQKRPLILAFDPNEENNTSLEHKFHVFKKIKKEKKKNPCDYKKNICGYITKKIIREFTGPSYVSMVEKLCEEEKCQYQTCKAFYQGKIEHVTGPSHIPDLLQAENSTELNLKSVFRRFFEWFLRERYLRYLLLQGKMTNKKAYIEYKNTALLSLLKTTPSQRYSQSENEQNVEDD